MAEKRGGYVCLWYPLCEDMDCDDCEGPEEENVECCVCCNQEEVAGGAGDAGDQGASAGDASDGDCRANPKPIKRWKLLSKIEYIFSVTCNICNMSYMIISMTVRVVVYTIYIMTTLY